MFFLILFLKERLTSVIVFVFNNSTQDSAPGGTHGAITPKSNPPRPVI